MYRTPSPLVQAKVRPGLDPASVAFIGRSPFVLVGSRDDANGLDVSPRGGPPGFVSVTDDANGQSFVVLPDLNGNNLIDTFSNVVSTGHAGMLFFVPGRGESLRVNGAAWITNDDELLETCRPPDFAQLKAALIVRPDQVFIHCAKAFKRSGLWDPSTWSPDDAPDGVDILAAQGIVAIENIEAVRSSLNAGYTTELAADRQA
jgi:uncharacterized protein